MKRFISILTALFLLLQLCACSAGSEKNNNVAGDVENSVPEESGPTELTMATIGSPLNIVWTVENFNRDSDEYKIVINDYSQNGRYSQQDALHMLNTEIISGKHPDLMAFGEIDPQIYAKKGYLVDLNTFLDSDGELNREDIAIYKPLSQYGGLYFLVDSFCIETAVGQYSQFGDAMDWTFDEYLEIEKSRPLGAETMYNTTKESFLRRIAASYLHSAVDWEAGTCDFDNETFITILETANRVRENPEPENPKYIDYTYGSVSVAQGDLVAVASYINQVWRLAYDEGMAGCKLSFIGWPTMDGSCGSNIHIGDPVGICSASENAEGCWEFIKYMVTGFNIETPGIMPVYTPSLEQLLSDAMVTEPPYGGVIMTQEDVDRFKELLYSIDEIALYDENIFSIIDEESSALFSGEKTAGECAKLIQDRVSLYVAEQG